MKHLIIFIIIIIGILLIKCNTMENFLEVNSDRYIQSNTTIKYSYKIESNGVFANKKFNKGDVIEICPAIIEKLELLKLTNKLKDCYFEYDVDYGLIALGYGSVYNHSDSPNAMWQVIDQNTLKIIALTQIDVDDEIYISYGDEFWKNRKHIIKK